MHEVIKAERESQRPANILLLWGIFQMSWPTVLMLGIILQFRGQRDGHTPTAHRVDVIRLLGWEYTSDRPAPLSSGLRDTSPRETLVLRSGSQRPMLFVNGTQLMVRVH
jgi:hypothetical protein